MKKLEWREIMPGNKRVWRLRKRVREQREQPEKLVFRNRAFLANLRIQFFFESERTYQVRQKRSVIVK